MKFFVTDPLEQDAINMGRWDPTEIIAVPFPEENLRYLVFKSFVSSLLISTILYALERWNPHESIGMPKAIDSDLMTAIVVDIPKNALSSTILQVLLAVVIHLLGILLGAPIGRKWFWHSVLASLYVSSLAFGFIQSNRNTKPLEGNVSYITLLLRPIVHIMIGPDSPADGEESKMLKSEDSKLGFSNWTMLDQINRCILYSTFLIMVPFMILNILDHGDQIQRWPVPIILGSTVGHVVGVVVGIASVWGSIVVRNVRRKIREHYASRSASSTSQKLK